MKIKRRSVRWRFSELHTRTMILEGRFLSALFFLICVINTQQRGRGEGEIFMNCKLKTAGWLVGWLADDAAAYEPLYIIWVCWHFFFPWYARPNDKVKSVRLFSLFGSFAVFEKRSGSSRKTALRKFWVFDLRGRTFIYLKLEINSLHFLTLGVFFRQEQYRMRSY